MADGLEPGGRIDGAPDSDKRIGRRAFIGLVVAGLAALFLGKDLFPSIWEGSGGGGSEGSFRINSVVHGPEFDRASWRLRLDGLFRAPVTLTYDDVVALPQVERVRDFYCVEGWGVTDVRWRGVTIRELMKLGDIDPLATHLVFYSGDDVYDDSLTLDEALREDSMIAYEMNGEPLQADMGQPLRLVLPGSYAYKNVKWVVRVEAIQAGNYSGYWEDRGYPSNATIR